MRYGDMYQSIWSIYPGMISDEPIFQYSYIPIIPIVPIRGHHGKTSLCGLYNYLYIKYI